MAGHQAATAEVVRPRITDLMRTSDASVVFVTGPAGAGKSTTVRQWSVGDHRHFRWLMLGPVHNDPATLAAAVVGALTDSPDSSGFTTVITASQPEFSATVLPAIEALLQSPGRPGVLVLDDVHHITDRRAIDVLKTLTRSSSGSAPLVLISRGSTPDYLSRVRSSGRLLEVGPDELAFTHDEARRLFAAMGLPTDQAAEATMRAEGWAVVLYLTALGARHRGRTEELPRPRGSDRYVVDYCRAEVLADLSEAEVDFLLQTSVLDRLTGQLCDAVLDRSDSGALLRSMQERFHLVRRLDDTDDLTYRYHSILAAAMRAELNTRDSSVATRVLTRAADHYAAAGDTDRAIEAAKSAGDLSRVAQFIWADIATCLMSGRPDLLRTRMKGLSDTDIEADVWLMLAAGWLALQSADRPSLLRWTLALNDALGPNVVERAESEPAAAVVALLRGVLAGPKTGPPFLAAAARHLPATSYLQPTAELTLGVFASLRHEAAVAERHLVRAIELADALDVPQPGVVAHGWRSLLAASADDWGRAEAEAQSAWEGLKVHGLAEMGSSALVHVARAVVLARRHHRHASEAIAAGRRMTTAMGEILPWFAVAGRYYLAAAAAGIGDKSTGTLLAAEADALFTAEDHGTLLDDLRRTCARTLAALSTLEVADSALTDAELRVLAFLPSHLSKAQIGNELYVSTNTVKSHVTAIYRKLGVSSRGAAVEQARTLGLLPPSPR